MRQTFFAAAVCFRGAAFSAEAPAALRSRLPAFSSLAAFWAAFRFTAARLTVCLRFAITELH